MAIGRCPAIAHPRRWATWTSPIDLAEYDIERADDGGNVGEHVATAEEIHGLKVREGRRADTAFIGLVGALGDQVDAELSLRRLGARGLATIGCIQPVGTFTLP